VGVVKGDSLLESAQACADKNLFGIAVHRPGVGRLSNAAGKLGVSNREV